MWRDRTITFLGNEKTINKDILCSTIWQYDVTKNKNMILLFYLDNEFKIGFYQSGPDLSGKYEIISDNSVKLYDFSESHYVSNFIDIPEQEIILHFDNNYNNIFFNKVLKSNATDLYFGALGGQSVEDQLYVVL